MTLTAVTALAASTRLCALPQTHRVFAVPGPASTYTLVWVLHDGSRRNLDTEGQVLHALGGDARQ